MSRSVTFNGITRFRPGGITKINAEALNVVGISSAGAVGLIGESSSGASGAVAGLVSLRDASQATALYGDGPLVDAIRLAFQSSGDPNIPGGASEVVIYKTNASTQSSIQVPNPASTLVSDTAAAGSTTTAVNLTTGGLTIDDLIGRWVDFALTGLPALATVTATAGTTTTATAVGLTAGQYVGNIVQFGAATTTPALQNQFATIIANNGLTITFAEVLPAPVAVGDVFDIIPTYRRRITNNTATSLTVDALPAAPTAGDAVFVRPSLLTLTSKDYGAGTESISVDLLYTPITGTYQVSVNNAGAEQASEPLGGQNFLQLFYRGGANAVATDTVATPASVTATSVDLTTGGLVANAHDGASVLITNADTGESEQVRISTNAAAALTFEAPGLSNAFVAELQSATTILVDISTVTEATATIAGASGAATSFTTAITGVTGDNLSIPITSTMTVKQLVDQINQRSTYLAVVPNGINGDISLASQFDFGTSTRINIQKEVARNGGTGFKQDTQQIINWFVDSSADVTAVRASSASLDGSVLPRSDAAIDALFASPFGLLGGARGVSTNSSFQAGLDLMLTRQIDNVVPLVDQDLVNEGFGSTAMWASVSQQLVDHVARARGAVGLERGAFMGFRGTRDEFMAAANSLNDADIQLVSQYPTVLDATGTLTMKGPRELAVMGASMRSGVQEVGEPLTHKYLRTSSISQDSSWDPRDNTDATLLIQAGCLFAENVPGRGIRWVRDLTTWVRDDNLAYAEGSVRSIVRVIAYQLRTTLEDRFTGKKAAPATVAAVKDAAAAYLESARSGGLIVDSTDPATGSTIRAYYGLRVTSSGDILNIVVSIFPVPGINFQLTEIFLQLPTQSA